MLLGFVLLPLLFTPLLRADSSQGDILVPYLAVGGDGSGLHFETLLVVGNPSRASTVGVIDVYDEDIQPLPIALDGDRGLQAEFRWAVPAGMARKFQLSHPGESVRSGWIRVKPSAKQDLDLIVVLRMYDGETLLSEDGLIFPSKQSGSLPHATASSTGALFISFKQSLAFGQKFELGEWRQPEPAFPYLEKQDLAPGGHPPRLDIHTHRKEV